MNISYVCSLKIAIPFLLKKVATSGEREADFKIPFRKENCSSAICFHNISTTENLHLFIVSTLADNAIVIFSRTFCYNLCLLLKHVIS